MFRSFYQRQEYLVFDFQKIPGKEIIEGSDVEFSQSPDQKCEWMLRELYYRQRTFRRNMNDMLKIWIS